MRGKRLSERTMGHAKLEILVNYYLADMQRRGCADDSVGTNRRALRRFARSVNPESSSVTLLEVTDEVVEGGEPRILDRIAPSGLWGGYVHGCRVAMYCDGAR
jgi:hypothetical protein